MLRQLNTVFSYIGAVAMRIVLAIHNYFNDPNTGAMQSVRTVMKWLAQAGHECHVLCTARIDTSVELDPQQHLEQLGIDTQRHAPPKRYIKRGKSVRRVPTGRPTLSYTVDGVNVTMLMTQHNKAAEPDRAEAKQFITLLEGMFDRVKPDLLFSYGLARSTSPSASTPPSAKPWPSDTIAPANKL